MVLSLLVIGAAQPGGLADRHVHYVFVDVLVDISMNLQGSWISARRHAPVMIRLHGLWSLGILAGGLGAVAANAAGLSTLTHLVIVVAVMALVLLFVTRSLLADDEEGHGAAAVGPPAPNASRRTRLAPVVLLMFAGMFAVVAEVTGGDWASFRLTDDFGAAAAVASSWPTPSMTSMRFPPQLLSYLTLPPSPSAVSHSRRSRPTERHRSSGSCSSVSALRHSCRSSTTMRLGPQGAGGLGWGR